MKIHSAKAKGRRAAQKVKEALIKASDGYLQEADINVTSSSVPGEDLNLSPKARALFPFTFEVKCQEKLAIWQCLEQSEEHAKDTPHYPILAFTRNRSELYMTMRLNDFLEFLFDKEEIEPCPDTSPISSTLI